MTDRNIRLIFDKEKKKEFDKSDDAFFEGKSLELNIKDGVLVKLRFENMFTSEDLELMLSRAWNVIEWAKVRAYANSRMYDLVNDYLDGKVTKSELEEKLYILWDGPEMHQEEWLPDKEYQNILERIEVEDFNEYILEEMPFDIEKI